MRKLALSDEILLSIQQPARYIGGEVNMVKKDPDKVDIRFAMCFPDVYEIGMSHLGIQILYSMFNRREDIYCERVYSPWTDLDKIMREKKIPLFALEIPGPGEEILISWESRCSMRCATPTFCRFWICPRFRFTPQTGRRAIPSSSAAAPAPTIRSRWPISSTCSISARERRFISN